MSQVIKQKNNLTALSWAKARQSSWTTGSFLKSFGSDESRKVYYKLSDYDPVNGIIGHECINEIVVCRLLEILGVEHVDYQLIHADVVIDGKTHETWLNASEDFKRPGESKVALDTYYALERQGDETPLEFCIRHGWGQQIWECLVVDYLILNRDRHGANLEVVRNPKARTLRLAPLYDHGLSLMFRARTDAQVAAFDVMADLPVQSFFATHSTRDNLGLVPPDKLPRFAPLRESDQTSLFDGLHDATTAQWRAKTWEMIWQRWCAYEAFRAERQR